jgi:hypothetical protein
MEVGNLDANLIVTLDIALSNDMCNLDYRLGVTPSCIL